MCVIDGALDAPYPELITIQHVFTAYDMYPYVSRACAAAHRSRVAQDLERLVRLLEILDVLRDAPRSARRLPIAYQVSEIPGASEGTTVDSPRMSSRSFRLVVLTISAVHPARVRPSVSSKVWEATNLRHARRDGDLCSARALLLRH